MVQRQDAGSASISRESRAYRDGWEDGRFGTSGASASDIDTTGLTDAERLSYYRGHREGQRIREMLLETVRLA